VHCLSLAISPGTLCQQRRTTDVLAPESATLPGTSCSTWLRATRSRALNRNPIEKALSRINLVLRGGNRCRVSEKTFSSDFMPHGYCYLWTPGIIWLHGYFRCTIALSYYLIP